MADRTDDDPRMGSEYSDARTYLSRLPRKPRLGGVDSETSPGGDAEQRSGDSILDSNQPDPV